MLLAYHAGTSIALIYVQGLTTIDASKTPEIHIPCPTLFTVASTGAFVEPPTPRPNVSKASKPHRESSPRSRFHHHKCGIRCSRHPCTVYSVYVQENQRRSVHFQ